MGLSSSKSQKFRIFGKNLLPQAPNPLDRFSRGRGSLRSAHSCQISPSWIQQCGLKSNKIVKICNFLCP